MARGRKPIPQNRPVFVAGEGLSEQGYGRWIGRLGAVYGVPIAVRAEGLHGGDPLDLVNQAVRKLRIAERRGAKYPIRSLFLDHDTFGKNPENDQLAIEIAQDKGFFLIQQMPCHEGFLLAHFDDCPNPIPNNPPEAMAILKQIWPNYSKGMDAIRYGSVLSVGHLERARQRVRELDDLLSAIGWRVPRS